MGAELYYQMHGEGLPVLFAHGLGGNRASWFQQVPFFAGFYRVITFDHRGFGNSRDLDGGADRSVFVEDLKKLLDYLGMKKVALIGQSMGGGTCCNFAVRYPERVSALVLADTLVGIKLPPVPAARMEVVRKQTSELPQLERVLSHNFRAEQPILTHLYSEINSFNLGARETARGSFGEGVTAEQLTATKLPILFLVGSEDILFPPDSVKEVHQMIPGSKFVVVTGAGHSVYFEAPERFNRAVLEFLKLSAVACG